MNDIKDVKENIILSFAILLFLFTLCIVIYNINWNNNDLIDVSTNISFDGGNDALSQELQNIIPYVTLCNPKYVTAYQNKEVSINDIDNDILLTKGYFYAMKSNYFDSGELLLNISNLYGNDLFIVNKDFNVNGKNYCTYNNHKYSCDEIDYNGILYKANRDIFNINIGNDIIYLTENILFYSEEKIQNITEYKVYNNGLYENVVLTFTSNDIDRKNVTFEEYIDNLTNLRVQYQSSFVINNDKYNWIGTVIL